MRQRLFFACVLLSMLATQCVLEADQQTENTIEMPDTDIWVGTYTRKEGHVDGKAAGIYRYSRRDSSWHLKYTEKGIVNPSYLALSPDGSVLYAVSELGPASDTTGYVYAYAVKDDGLELLNRQPSYSFAPCYLSVSPDGKRVFVANYVGGTIVRYPVLPNGSLGEATDWLKLEGTGPDTLRQEDSHPHSTTLSPDGRWVMVADLGTDLIHTFSATTDEWKEQSSIKLPGGAGPRHLVFHPDADFAYSINELNSTVTAFHYDAENGALNILDHYTTLPADYEGFNLTADIHLTPDGHYLYASNRGHNSIAGFKVDQATGQLSPLGHVATQGDFPRNFAIHPSGAELWVANQNSDHIMVFKLHPQTGLLEPRQELAVKTPVCLVWGG